jgi:CRP/FNR family cyclic AMP-dependent transcriptional regulator
MPGLLDLLDDAERRRVRAGMARRRFPAGQAIFHEGDPGDTLHLVDRGHVAVRVTTPLGDVVTLAVLGPGQALGEMALLVGGGRRTASAVCLDAVETLAMDHATYESLRRSSAEVAAFVAAALAAQVRDLNERLVEALYVPAEQRVLRRVAELASIYRSPGTADGDPVTIALTQDDVASMAGTTRSTANRVLKAVEADGLVNLRRGAIEVLDLAGLERRGR